MMSERPQISILLPVHDAAATLPACLASIARQTLSAWECVIVDDGSTDGSRALAGDAARRDPRVRVVPIPHVGLVAALNEGLHHCRAPLVARMDGDDVMHRERLAAQLQAIEADAGLSAIGCHVRFFPRRELGTGMREYETWLNGLRSAADVTRDAFVECPIAHPSLIMRREMAALGYAQHDWPEDYDLMLRALAAGLRIGILPRRLLSWRRRPDSLCRSDGRYAVDRFTACKAHYLARGFLARDGEYILWGYGGTGRSLSKALARLGKRPMQIIDVKPTRLGNRIAGVPVVPPEHLRDLARRPIVVSVARPGPRREIRAALASMGFTEQRDFLCAA